MRPVPGCPHGGGCAGALRRGRGGLRRGPGPLLMRCSCRLLRRVLGGGRFDHPVDEVDVAQEVGDERDSGPGVPLGRDQRPQVLVGQGVEALVGLVEEQQVRGVELGQATLSFCCVPPDRAPAARAPSGYQPRRLRRRWPVETDRARPVPPTAPNSRRCSSTVSSGASAPAGAPSRSGRCAPRRPSSRAYSTARTGARAGPGPARLPPPASRE